MGHDCAAVDFHITLALDAFRAAAGGIDSYRAASNLNGIAALDGLGVGVILVVDVIRAGSVHGEIGGRVADEIVGVDALAGLSG